MKAKKLYQQATRDIEGVSNKQVRNLNRALDQRDIDYLANFLDLPLWRTNACADRFLIRGSAAIGGIIPGWSELHRQRINPFTKTMWPRDLDPYANLFATKESALSGDITPGYSTLHPRVIKKIMSRFSGLKVVFIARDPVERLWSSLVMRAHKGRGPWPIDKAIVKGLLRKGHIRNRTYQTQIVARWRRFVPDAQFGLFVFDDLVKNADEFRGRILSFLGGDPGKPSGVLPAGFNRKEHNVKAPLPDELRALISQILADELIASAAEFGGGATSWPGKYGL